MSRGSSTASDREPHPWLEEHVYAPKRQRTVDLVTRAVDALLAERARDHGTTRISLGTIVARSRQLDPAGKGISQTAILGNPEARAYYERHRTAALAPPPAPPRPAVTAPPVAAGRDLTRVRRRYLRLGKAELVERLVATEQARASAHERWLAATDELLAWRLRAEEAERRLQAQQAAPRLGEEGKGTAVGDL